MIRPLAVATTALATLATSGAAADSRRAPADVRAVIPGPSLATSTLVGRSGQLYVPDAESGGWKREGRGGVACDVLGAFKLSGTLWAACSRAPLFARERGVWSARPLPNRGRSRVTWHGGDPIISVGRHIYTWRGGWKRRGSAPGRIKSLHAESARQLLAVTTRRQLVRGGGSRWSVVVDAPRRRDKSADPPARVLGSSSHSYAITESGAIAVVGRSGVSPLSLPAGVSDLDVGTSVALPDGDVLAEAAITRAGRTETGLIRLSGSSMAIEPGPSFEAGERVGLLYVLGAEILCATRRGRVFVRDASGAWSAKPVANEPPSDTTNAANGGPAPTK